MGQDNPSEGIGPRGRKRKDLGAVAEPAAPAIHPKLLDESSPRIHGFEEEEMRLLLPTVLLHFQVTLHGGVEGLRLTGGALGHPRPHEVVHEMFRLRMAPLNSLHLQSDAPHARQPTRVIAVPCEIADLGGPTGRCRRHPRNDQYQREHRASP